MRIPVKCICQYCGRQFLGTYKSKFCRNACRQASYRLRKAALIPSNVTMPANKSSYH
jgi:hypothetical protein